MMTFILFISTANFGNPYQPAIEPELWKLPETQKTELVDITVLQYKLQGST